MAGDEDNEFENQRALDEDDEQLRDLVNEVGPLEEPLPPKEVAFGFTSAELVDVTLSEDPRVQQVRIAQLAEMLGFRDIALEEFDKCELEAAMASVRGYAPKDETERQQTYHIVAMNKTMGQAMHDVAASYSDLRQREAKLNMALKLHTAITKGTEAIDKHRNKGKQKIIIERIQVDQGGNAVVGDVDARKYVQNNHTEKSGDVVNAEPHRVRSRKPPKQQSS